MVERLQGSKRKEYWDEVGVKRARMQRGAGWQGGRELKRLPIFCIRNTVYGYLHEINKQITQDAHQDCQRGFPLNYGRVISKRQR